MSEKEQYPGSDFWASAYEGAAEEAIGGIVGKMRVDLGYKVYIAGMTGDEQEKTFFPVDASTEDARAKARGIARTFAQKHGLTGRAARADYVAHLRMYANECVNITTGQPVEWAGDQLKTVSLWTLRSAEASAGKVFMNALQENRVPAKVDFYGRAVWVPDPYKVAQGEAGKTDEDQEGNPRVPLFPIVVETYTDKAACVAAAEAAAASSDGTEPTVYKWDDFPGEWGDDDWGKLADDFEMVSGDLDNIEEYIDEEFDADLTWFVRLLSVAGRDINDIVKYTGLKKKDVKKALK